MIRLIFLYPKFNNLLTIFAPIKPAPPVIKIESRAIMGDMIDIICAICRKKQQLKLLYNATFRDVDIEANIYSARRLPDRVHYRIVKCERCGLVFSSPIFPLAKISKFYKKSLCNYQEQIPYLIKTYMGLFDGYAKTISQNPKVLEIGCGNGFFLSALVKRRIKDVHGVEPSPSMVSLAGNNLKQRIKVDIFKKNQFPKNTFDIIFCFHTLDHLIDPNEFIRESFSLLKKGGLVLVVVHDTNGLSVKIFGERSPIFDIEHIYLFNKKTLRAIFEENGFEVSDAFDVINTYTLSYWVRMSGLPLFIKDIGQKTLDIFKLSKISLSLAGGNIGILAKKPS